MSTTTIGTYYCRISAPLRTRHSQQRAPTRHHGFDYRGPFDTARLRPPETTAPDAIVYRNELIRRLRIARRAAVQSVLETHEHEHESEFDVPTLARHFAAMLCWRMTLERQCAVRRQPTQEEIAELSATIVDDFMKAFLKRK